jgi:hypothetical protein
MGIPLPEKSTKNQSVDFGLNLFAALSKKTPEFRLNVNPVSARVVSS